MKLCDHNYILLDLEHILWWTLHYLPDGRVLYVHRISIQRYVRQIAEYIRLIVEGK